MIFEGDAKSKPIKLAETKRFIQAVIDLNSAAMEDSLRNGADINTQDFDYKETAAIRLARGNKLSLLKILMNYHPDLSRKERSGNTALSEAAHNGHIQVVKYLVEVGCDTQIKNDKGKTAEQRAQKEGYKDIAQLLQIAA